MNHGNEFDDILDAALREYREAEPLAGIEDRVLRRLTSRAARQPSSGWRWRVAAAALAALAALVWIGVRHAYQVRSSAPQLAQKTPTVPVSPEFAQIRSETHSTPEGPVRRRGAKASMQRSTTLAASSPVPLKGRFPTPAPLDREERALLTLAQKDPVALRPFLHGEDSPAGIAPITIEPLERSGGTEGED